MDQADLDLLLVKTESLGPVEMDTDFGDNAQEQVARTLGISIELQMVGQMESVPLQTKKESSDPVDDASFEGGGEKQVSGIRQTFAKWWCSSKVERSNQVE